MCPREMEEKMTPNLTIAIIQPHKDQYSETFLRAHADLLPAKIKVLYGGFFPSFYENQPIITKFEIIKNKILRRFLGMSSEDLQSRSLVRFLLREKVDVVLAEFGPTGVAVMQSCVIAGIPLVVHFHGADAYQDEILKTHTKSYPLLLKIAQAIIAVSTDMRSQLKGLGAPGNKIFLNPYGVDCTFFAGATPKSSPPHFLSVARFVEKKGHFLTLLAFNKVLKQCPQAKLVLVGDGPWLNPCRILVRALKIESAVEFTGVLPPIEIVDLMRNSRAYVQHSLTAADGDAEGLPVSILEAGACGLPVIATRHKGITEAVIDGETGLLVDEGDIDSMAEHMLHLAQDPDLAALLGHNARLRIEQDYTQEKSIQNLYQILLKIAMDQKS